MVKTKFGSKSRSHIWLQIFRIQASFVDLIKLYIFVVDNFSIAPPTFEIQRFQLTLTIYIDKIVTMRISQKWAELRKSCQLEKCRARWDLQDHAFLKFSNVSAFSIPTAIFNIDGRNFDAFFRIRMKQQSFRTFFWYFRPWNGWEKLLIHENLIFPELFRANIDFSSKKTDKFKKKKVKKKRFPYSLRPDRAFRRFICVSDHFIALFRGLFRLLFDLFFSFSRLASFVCSVSGLLICSA